MTTYYNHPRMTAVPTRLLLDTNLSAEAKLTGALLYTFKVDYTEQKKLAAAVSRVASNVNQICRRINSTGHFYDADVAELKERMADVWELLKVRQKDEL